MELGDHKNSEVKRVTSPTLAVEDIPPLPFLIDELDIHTQTKACWWVFWDLAPYSEGPERRLTHHCHPWETDKPPYRLQSQHNCLDPSYLCQGKIGWVLTGQVLMHETELANIQPSCRKTPAYHWRKKKRERKKKKKQLVTVEVVRVTLLPLPLPQGNTEWTDVFGGSDLSCGGKGKCK